jgi:cytochrome c peroxidase
MLGMRLIGSLRKSRRVWTLIAATAMVGALLGAALPNLFPSKDPSGVLETYHWSSPLDENGPFFQSLGTNGRSCATCHVPANAFALSAAHAESIYQRTRGHDPLFATVDGAACPTATPNHPLNFELLRKYGLFRIALTLVPNPQFTISVVHDPYGCALVTDMNSGAVTVSVYRRPLPATNLEFLTAVQFDGRETVAPLNDAKTYAANLMADLKHQALDATLGHAEASVIPTDAQLKQIVAFEAALNSAQSIEAGVGRLDAGGVLGGPQFLSKTLFFPGINDPLGGNPTGAAFNPKAFTLYAKWTNSPDPDRSSIARGEEIFNTHPLFITDVRGLNDASNQPVINGTCSTCHDAPNVGNHSLPLPLEIGTSRSARFDTNPQIQAALSRLSMPDLPVFQIACNKGPDAGEITYTSDPGKATLTGLCTDVGRGKGPILRGLVARAPYFHNGSAATLDEVVEFYNDRFQMNLTEQDKRDLVNFLKSL